MEIRLAPIENPSSLYLKMVYWWSKSTFGKVMTPLKVISARFPASIPVTMKLAKAHKRLTLDRELATLISVLVAQENACSFCADIAMAFAVKEKVGTQRFAHLHQFAESPHFSESEKAALAFAHEINRNFEASEETFAALRPHFSERQIVEISWIVATENYYNHLNRPMGIHSDGLYALANRKK